MINILKDKSLEYLLLFLSHSKTNVPSNIKTCVQYTLMYWDCKNTHSESLLWQYEIHWNRLQTGRGAWGKMISPIVKSPTWRRYCTALTWMLLKRIVNWSKSCHFFRGTPTSLKWYMCLTWARPPFILCVFAISIHLRLLNIHFYIWSCICFRMRKK